MDLRKKSKDKLSALAARALRARPGLEVLLGNTGQHRELIQQALADLHFTPTARSSRNLIAEGPPREKIIQTGNTVIGARTETIVAEVTRLLTDEEACRKMARARLRTGMAVRRNALPMLFWPIPNL